MRRVAFAWEGVSKAIGPWEHLQVVELAGTETLASLSSRSTAARSRSAATTGDLVKVN